MCSLADRSTATNFGPHPNSDSDSDSDTNDSGQDRPGCHNADQQLRIALSAPLRRRLLDSRATPLPSPKPCDQLEHATCNMRTLHYTSLSQSACNPECDLPCALPMSASTCSVVAISTNAMPASATPNCQHLRLKNIMCFYIRWRQPPYLTNAMRL